MRMTRLLLLALAVGSSFSAVADFHPDSRHQDNDGDIIADIPTDPAKQVDPSTLIFAHTPIEDPTV